MVLTVWIHPFDFAAEEASYLFAFVTIMFGERLFSCLAYVQSCEEEVPAWRMFKSALLNEFIGIFCPLASCLCIIVMIDLAACYVTAGLHYKWVHFTGARRLTFLALNGKGGGGGGGGRGKEE